MPNEMPNGRATHDSTASAWGCLGRRGDSSATQKARQMSKNPAPDDFNSGSTNHVLIQALINAVVWRSYGLAATWLKRARKHGIGEGGSLYFPSGDAGMFLPLITAAEQDGREDVAQQGREYLARVVEWMRPMQIEGPIREVVTWLPSGSYRSDRDYLPTGPLGHVFFPGARALFGHEPPGSGWYMSGPATVLYQWLTDTPGRTLPGRFAGYTPSVGVNGCWDSWPWMTAMIRGWIPAKPSPQPETMRAAYTRESLSEIPVEHESGPYKLRFGMEAIRFADGSMLCTCSHVTASPKPPVSWVEYHAPSDTVRLAAPDGLRTRGSTGKGSITVRGPSVYATARSDDGVVMDSLAYRVDEIVSHLVLGRNSVGPWKPGRLHPKAEPPGPPPPGPNPPEPPDSSPRRNSDWVRYRYLAIALALAGALIWWQAC